MNSEEQASLWAARCDGSELTPAERAELDAWLQSDPAHPGLLAEFQGVSGILRAELPALVADGLAALPPPPAPASRRRWLWPVLGLTGAIAAVLVFSLVSRPAAPESFATGGERRTVILPDGSEVELSAHTSIVVNAMSRRERAIELRGGEAYFAVAKDHGRPFFVHTPAGSVRVTGTKFDVCSESPADLEVTVAEGSVEVRPDAPKPPSSGVALVIRLQAGDHFSLGLPGRVRHLSGSEVEDALAWRRGEIVADGVPLRQILARFAYYHGLKVEVAADMAEVRVGGRYNLDDLDSFFSSLDMVLSPAGEVVHEADGTIRVMRRVQP